jgi:aerobic-type carbon monoxide dehydrogenase small subunit (CoxS/CutS family)
MERVSVTINGKPFEADIDERTLLIELLRDVAGLTGTHAGCWEARCGCCAVLVDGGAVKSCNVLALQVDGSDILTVEGLASDELKPINGDGFLEARQIDLESLHPLQTAFRNHGAVQCGFCTPGMLMVLLDFLQRNPDPSPTDVREAIRGNLCRCTGYQKIVDAALEAAPLIPR